MTKILNIRIDVDRETLYAQGYRWALVQPRGENIGRIISKHRTIEAADKAAKGHELQIANLGERH